MGIEDHLVVDEFLVTSVAQALGNDKRTQAEMISVGAQNGVIILNGQVSNAAIREAAEEVAASIPQVRGVVNYIQAPNVTVDPEEQKVLEPPIGGEVYATDMRIGQIERVIINPHNRHVTALVVYGYFPDLRHSSEHGLPDESTQQLRHVLEPIRAVGHETDSSVLLAVSGGEAARGREFDPYDFVSPPEGWQPPYPYQWDDVLFDRVYE